MNNQKSFWLVWNENGRAPTFKHPDDLSAMREAERLAQANPGQRFHILESVATAEFRAVNWKCHARVEQPPF